ncbi:SDR family oxidoreductase [Alienimonas chondri]|uniref:Oxidoreductase n=1 Tax=Alienimonas chondri TaxID=2681879 RepID=A0ABX1V8J6_9PLAN|nr:SDR family oxidoreductase [Alienimonas chondri]NNJ24311.1 hypothetical protein [Alienimonas chondri]
MSDADPNPFGPGGWTPDRLASQAGKTFVITGANAGAGFEATKLLVSRGAKVVMLCRSPEKAEAAIDEIRRQFPEADVPFVRLDLGSLASVREAAAAVERTVSKIDALICNAAIAQIAEQERTADGFESQLGVNHLGHFLLCGLLFDRIAESGGRIVVVSSLAYRMNLKRIQFEDLDFDGRYNAQAAYAQSKLAQMMFAYELQRRSREAGRDVQALVCHPGASRTSLIRKDAPLATRLLWKVLSPLAQSAEKGAWPEVMCAAEEGLEAEAFYGPTGLGEMVGPIGRSKLLPHALDREAAAKLWTISEEKTGLEWSPAA